MAVKYPHLREELIEYLRLLADPEAQEKAWGLDAQYGHGYFVIVMHFLLDDGLLADNPEAEIGIVLENRTEAQAVMAVTDAIPALFKKIGNNEDSVKYINHPDWQKVVAAAHEALKLFDENRQL